MKALRLFSRCGRNGTDQQQRATGDHGHPEATLQEPGSRSGVRVPNADIHEPRDWQEEPGVCVFEKHQRWHELALEQLYVGERHEVQDAIHAGQTEVPNSDDPRKQRLPGLDGPQVA